MRKACDNHRLPQGLTNFLLALLGCSPIYSPSLDAAITVPTDASTIQAGIDMASTGDTVRVLAGTYTGPGNKGIDFGGKDVVLISALGADSTILDLQASNRAFNFTSGETRSCVVYGFTIRHGLTIGGSGVWCQNSSPTIRKCTFESNQAGGFEPNGAGGAIYSAGVACSLLVYDCDFRWNWAAWGGAILAENGAYVDVRHSNFEQNVAFEGLGGAICLNQGAKAYIFNCTFDSNSAYFGGALQASHSSNYLGSYLVLSRSQATLGGAAIDLSDSSHANLDRVTIALGQSTSSASGIRCGDYSSVFLDKAIVAHGVSGPAVSLDGFLAGATFFCSDIYGNAGGDWVGSISGQLGINNNFHSDPLLCDTASNEFAVQEVSQCVPWLNACGEWIGALEWSCACCTTARGNVNNDGAQSVDISDLTMLVNYFFRQGVEPSCEGQADVDWDVALTVADITYLVGYMFKGGPPPPPCL